MKTRTLLLITILALAAPAFAASPTTPGEYPVKAALLVKFVDLVEWPANAESMTQPSFSVCVLGKNPFGQELEKAFAGKKHAGKPVVSLHVTRAAQVRLCGVLFVGGESGGQVAKRFADAPVLTVGEAQGFAGGGGIIEFVRDQGRIRFVVDSAAATTAGLKLDPQLAQFTK